MWIWLAILMLIDAGLVLWYEPRLKSWAPKLPLRKLALLEAGLALLIAAIAERDRWWPLLFP